jgi:hypothetical protein
MASGQAATDFLTAVAQAWPAAAWRDVHVLVGVSGGADSMALLRALLELTRPEGGAGRIFAGHVNHKLRGAASFEYEAWLARECERLGRGGVRKAEANTYAEAQADGEQPRRNAVWTVGDVQDLGHDGSEEGQKRGEDADGARRRGG